VSGNIEGKVGFRRLIIVKEREFIAGVMGRDLRANGRIIR
jgi:hypothetical protein